MDIGFCSQLYYDFWQDKTISLFDADEKKQAILKQQVYVYIKNYGGKWYQKEYVI